MVVWLQLPLFALQLSSVQAKLSLQFLAVPEHVPLAQVSALVHGLPSLQPAVAFSVCVQLPVPLSQASMVHALPSPQFLVSLPPHFPPWHASFTVHGLPSLHVVLPPALTIVHIPVWSLHVATAQTLPVAGQSLF